MMTIVLYLTGLLLSSVGLLFILVNVSLLIVGYTFWQYIIFVFSNFECLIFFIGLLILVFVYERR